MDCKEINIWLDHATPDEISNPDKAREGHIAGCSSCSKSHQLLVQAFIVIDNQKNTTLEDNQAEAIIKSLKNNQVSIATTNPLYRLSKLAAVAVILLGLTAGFLAGILFSVNTPSDTTDNWSTEFSMLSENEDYLISIFD